MQALILAGGKGTRLRPLTVYTPKPIVPVMNRPFLLFQIDILRRAGIKEIILSLNYQPNKIEQILGDGSEFGVHIRYVTEPFPMGTAGAFKYAANEISDTTIIFNGDILTDIDVSNIIKQHKSRNAEATIVLTPVENPTRYGLVETETDLRVKRFREKPSQEEVASLPTKNINAGIYVIEPSLLDLIPESENYSFEYNFFPDLLEKNREFYAYVMHDNYWRDLGTPKSYLQAHHDFLEGKIKGFELEKRKDSDVSHTAIVDNKSFIGKDCVIKPNARVINSIIGNGVHLEEKVVVENSVIWSHTRVSNSSFITDSIIGRSCTIGRNVTINAGSVLGDKTLLTDYTIV